MAGDYILKQLSNTFKRSIGTNDTVVRWGGEEFLIMLPHAGIIDATQIAEKIRNTIEKAKFYYENNRISITLSMGVVTTDHDVDMKEFIKLADKMLYKAKGKRNLVKSLDCSYFDSEKVHNFM